MATIRDNLVILSSKHIESIEFVNGSLVATQNQPYKKYADLSKDPEIFGILIQSGRKKTKNVADEFISRSGGKGKMFATQGGKDGSPEELNFCFSVDITWKGGEKTRIELGQGSNGFMRNNWWIGGSNIKANRIKVGSKDFEIDPISIKEDQNLDSAFDAITSKIPPQVSGLVNAFGRSIFKEFFRSVTLMRQ